MDELAHTNAPGSRHAKRWQDVEELLDAGIDVYTTLNVQHVESLNDVVAQITGVVVRETVPDRVLEEATEVRLIDLPPDELLERLQEGKVYIPDQAAPRRRRASFARGTSSRCASSRCGAPPSGSTRRCASYRTEHGIQRVWPTTERVLVCVSPSPSSARLVRAARRMAASLHAPCIAAYVETPASLRMSDADRRASRREPASRRAARRGDRHALKGESAAAGDGPLRARAQRDEDRPRQADAPALARPRLARRFSTRSSGRAATSTSTSSRATTRRDEPASKRPSERPEARTPAPTPPSAAMRHRWPTALAWVRFGRRQLADVVMIYLLGHHPRLAALRLRAVASSRRCSASCSSTSSSCRRT